MTKIQLTCRYCGKKWSAEVRTKSEVESMACKVCGDTSLVVAPAPEHDGDIFGYHKGESNER